MIEELLACATLLKAGLMSNKEYESVLDALFMKMPENALLLDLEYVSTNMDKTISIVCRYYEEHSVDFVVFGQSLMDVLRKAYSREGTDLEDFAAKTYAAWETLPSAIQITEPFWTMNYAYEPLFWGDGKQTRDLYEKMFCFYDEQKNV